MRADLHVHSTYSDDGRQTVAEILARCKELGIGAVAISDHNVMEAHKEADTLGSGIIIVPAMEITTEAGHVLALGIREPVARGLPVGETIGLVHAAGGIAVAAHPYRAWSGLGEQNVMGHDFDAVEISNGRSKRIGNLRARRLAKRMCLPGTGGSDAHNVQSIGRAFTEVPDSCRDHEDVIKAIMDRRCRAFGSGQGTSGTAGTGIRSVLRWFRRGFRRM
ncbi:MAG: CehA/McbA family metallohydrolase [Methanomassiliicoccus sp.]|nr:CehA/McbA family metallohydrolase [Methanomassiliicoccus sp.]